MLRYVGIGFSEEVSVQRFLLEAVTVLEVSLFVREPAVTDAVQRCKGAREPCIALACRCAHVGA